MGLSGRKTKQRIPNDPRNLAWANGTLASHFFPAFSSVLIPFTSRAYTDASKFGAAYLAKLGWDPSRGLGVSGEGRTSALSVHQKLDMLGIGADHKNSAEGLAWKQNKDFENLLRRLNAANGDDGEAGGDVPMKIDGFVRPSAQTPGEEDVGEETVQDDAEEGSSAEAAEVGKAKKEKKKRKKGTEDDDGERKKKRKKSKTEDQDSDGERSSKKEKKKKRRDADESSVSLPTLEVSATPSSTPVTTPASSTPAPAKQ